MLMVGLPKTTFMECCTVSTTKLIYFDLDDVIVSHDDKLSINVYDKKGVFIKNLSSKEFANYNLQENEVYDFTEFRSSYIFKESSQPIKQIVYLINVLKQHNKNVEILTARSDFDCKYAFKKHMATIGIDIDEIHVRRAGNLGISDSALAKKEYVDIVLEKADGYYHEVHLYDDSEKNLEYFLSLKKKYPDVTFYANHVIFEPHSKNVRIISKKS